MCHYNLTRITGTLHEDLLCTFMKIFRRVLLILRNVLDRSCRETQNTHFRSSNFSFLKIAPLMGPCIYIYIYIYIYIRVDKAMHDNMAHAHCMVHTYVYNHTLRTCNTYCFFMATMVARTPLNLLNAELNPICHLMALLGAHHILHVSRARVNVTLYARTLPVFRP